MHLSRHPSTALLLAALLAPTLPRAAAAQPRAESADVASIDAIVAAVYDVISGPAGQARDWDRWRSLFIPEARLIPVGIDGSGTVTRRVMTPEDYVTSSGSFLEQNGFFEIEVSRVTEQFGHIAHLFSTYESRRAQADAEPFARGINSFQLMNDGDRWWVVSIMWNAERPGNAIPARYLRR